ncbi:hypothetical protein CKA32_002982 [Geitlerinema sp. FC II]|uniref:hypothetical protein n=1 Tax=Baaleninema simplex TaxID=2862350 RepID=UPI00034BFDB8|nr:hypothetical protein [Baaleninema simplex]MDC0834325.1 hypothetical protein [Geitlerinema sp. CS-897]PPT06231.1 hypothetical protein CKA32_002982 [Geitlerinema sp. FC II]
MSDRSGFTGGFLAGAVFGGVIGGVVGALLASRQSSNTTLNDDDRRTLPAEGTRGERLAGSEGMESARRTLEDKIAQLNETIDDVREQLHVVNGNARGDREPSQLEER